MGAKTSDNLSQVFVNTTGMLADHFVYICFKMAVNGTSLSLAMVAQKMAYWIPFLLVDSDASVVD